MKSGGARHTQPRKTVVLMILALAVSLVIILAAFGANAAAYQDTAQSAESDETVAAAPLVVPVYPRLNKKKDPSDDSKNQEMPEGADLRDSYIVMEDGSVLSMADWIKGSLTKNQIGAGMSDYDTRLFLGQVARSIAGQGESQVTTDVATVGPLRSYTAGGVPKTTAEKTLSGLVGLFLVTMPEDYSPARAGGGFDRRMATNGGAAILFEEQFQEAVGQSANDLREIGTMLNMLDSYKKKTGQ